MSSSSDNKIALELSLEGGESLISLLECPVCLEVMYPPIYLCENGHNVCSRCTTDEMTTCPTCRGKFIPTRNLVLEKMASRAKRPCLNVMYGCTEKFTLDVMEQHDRVCPFRMYDCVQTNCKWQGIRSFIKQHFKEKHPESMFELKNELNLSYKKISLENDCSFNYLFFKSDELFWYRSVRDSDKKTLSEVVQYIGPKENACKYVYEIVITTKARDQTVRVANVVRSDTEDLATIFEARNCFVMDFGMLKKFIVDGCYSYKIKMTKS